MTKQLETTAKIGSKRKPVQTPARAAHRVKEFCESLGICERTFWKYTRANRISVIRVGGCTLITEVEKQRILREGL